jgi:hypothetical protein
MRNRGILLWIVAMWCALCGMCVQAQIDPQAEKGDAVFRNLVKLGITVGHTAIYWGYYINGWPDNQFRHTVIEAVGTGSSSSSTVAYCPFDDESYPPTFLSGNTYWGAGNRSSLSPATWNGSANTMSAARRDTIITEAQQLIGTPYCWYNIWDDWLGLDGTVSCEPRSASPTYPSYIRCDGVVQWVYERVGFNMGDRYTYLDASPYPIDRMSRFYAASVDTPSSTLQDNGSTYTITAYDNSSTPTKVNIVYPSGTTGFYSSPATITKQVGTTFYQGVDLAGHAESWKQVYYSQPGQPDLTIVEPVLVSPTSVASGGTIQVGWTEKNQGTATSTPAHNTKIFLATSANAYGTTYQIGYYYGQNALGIGATYSYSKSIVVSASIPTGNYYVTAFIDCDQQVSEGSHEDNNIGSSSPTMLTVSTVNRGTLQFASSTYSVNENGGSVQIYLSRTGGSYGAASVSYGTANGTATAGLDYTSASGTLNWADGDTASKSFTVPMIDDSVYEGNETFTASLSGASGASLGSPTATTVTIIDNETPPHGTLQFASSTYSVNENGGSVQIYMSRTGGSYGAASVNFATANGTATTGSDYMATSGMVSWADGDTANKSFAVPIIDDSIYEGNETFTVSLSGASGASLGSPTSTTVTIIDNETPPDTTPPTVLINHPTGGQTFTALPITVDGTANDPGSPSTGVSLVQVQVNGTGGTWQTASGTTSWSASVSLISGANTIYVRSQDGAGNYSTISPVNVTYTPDTTPPTVTISSPANGQNFSSSTINVIGTASDPDSPSSGLASITINTGASNQGTLATWQFTVNLIPGPNTLVVSATDLAGNVGVSQIVVTNTDTNLLVLNNLDSWHGSLRQTIQSANYLGGGTITFSNVSGTIVLTNGPLTISQPGVNIIGPGSQILSVSGSRSNRVFVVATNSFVLISGLGIQDGRTRDGTNGVGGGSLQPAPGGPGEPGGGIYTAGTLTLKDCVISNNWTGGGGVGNSSGLYSITGGGDGGLGGSIYNLGNLILISCTLVNNHTGNGGPGGHDTSAVASGNGGAGAGIYNSGTLAMTNCTVNGNVTGHGGDGPGCNHPASSATGGSGGGIYSSGTLILSGCALWDNITGRGGIGAQGDSWGGAGGNGGSGGGIYASGAASIVNCTFAQNSTGAGGNGGSAFSAWSLWGGNGGNGGNGGGICCTSTITLTCCTLTMNGTGVHGVGGFGPVSSGVSGLDGAAGGMCSQTNLAGAQVLNTIVALNTGNYADVFGAYSSLGHNLIGITNGSSGFGIPGDLIGGNPLLGALADNGGPTLTCALLPGSPAIDVGTDSVTNTFATDQRGYPRLVGAHVDIGAVEGVYNAAGPGKLTGMTRLTNGIAKFTFTNYSDISFTVLASTNLALPVAQWSNLGSALETPVGSGHYQFTDPQAANNVKRFYRVRTP